MNDFNEHNSDTSKVLKNNELLLNNIEKNMTINIMNLFSHLQLLNSQIEVFSDQLENIEI